MALTQAPRGCAVNGSEDEKGVRQKRPGPRALGGQGERASSGSSEGPTCPSPHTHSPTSWPSPPPAEAERGPNGSSLVPHK
jgi:hypothetical protein